MKDAGTPIEKPTVRILAQIVKKLGAIPVRETVIKNDMMSTINELMINV